MYHREPSERQAYWNLVKCDKHQEADLTFCVDITVIDMQVGNGNCSYQEVAARQKKTYTRVSEWITRHSDDKGQQPWKVGKYQGWVSWLCLFTNHH